MEATKYWRVILAYRGMIILLCLSALATSVLIAYLLPEKYQSTALLLVRPQERINFAPNRTGKEVLDFPVSLTGPIDAPSKTYIEVVKSQALAEKVVRKLNLDKKKRIPKEGYFNEMWARSKEYTKDLLIDTWTVLKHGRLEEVDPFRRAVSDVQASLSLRTTKDTYIFEITNLSLAPQEAAIVANTAGEIFIEHMLDMNKSESKNIQLILLGLRSEAEKELAEARRALVEFKKTNATFSLSEEYAEKLKVNGALEADLERIEVKLSGFGKTFTSSHPKVESLLAERDRLIQSLAERRKELEALPEMEKQRENLKLQVDIAEKKKLLIMQEYEEAHIREVSNFSEMKIISPATPSTYPKQPIKIYYVGGGFMIAMIIGVALAFFLEYLKTIIRTVEDVDTVLQLPVLATIPLMRYAVTKDQSR